MTNSYYHASFSKTGNTILLQQFCSLHYPPRSPFTLRTTSTVMSKNRPPSTKGPERSCFKNDKGLPCPRAPHHRIAKSGACRSFPVNLSHMARILDVMP